MGPLALILIEVGFELENEFCCLTVTWAFKGIQRTTVLSLMLILSFPSFILKQEAFVLETVISWHWVWWLTSYSAD